MGFLNNNKYFALRASTDDKRADLWRLSRLVIHDKIKQFNCVRLTTLSASRPDRVVFYLCLDLESRLCAIFAVPPAH